MRTRYLLFLLMLVSLCSIPLGGCAPQPVELLTPAPNNGIIGTISRVNDQIQLGASANKLVPVAVKDTMKAGDFLQVSKGGEGLLDFGNYLELRLFNDTKMNAITLQHEDNIPLYARIQLEEGGFTGELKKNEGNKAVFETPNGATITITGTQFFVIYSSGDRVVAVGNFGGSVTVTAQNVTQLVSSNHYRIVKAGQPPEPEQVLTVDRPRLENMMRKQGSPVNVLKTAFVASTTPTAPTPTGTLTPTPTPSPSSTPSPTPTSTPTPTPACPPTLVMVRTALCRVGPGTTWQIMNAFPVGSAMVPSERSFSNPVWWHVPEPVSRLACWVSDTNVQVIGDASCVPVVSLYPVPGQSATQAAYATLVKKKGNPGGQPVTSSLTPVFPTAISPVPPYP